MREKFAWTMDSEFVPNTTGKSFTAAMGKVTSLPSTSDKWTCYPSQVPHSGLSEVITPDIIFPQRVRACNDANMCSRPASTRTWKQTDTTCQSVACPKSVLENMRVFLWHKTIDLSWMMNRPHNPFAEHLNFYKTCHTQLCSNNSHVRTDVCSPWSIRGGNRFVQHSINRTRVSIIKCPRAMLCLLFGLYICAPNDELRHFLR